MYVPIIFIDEERNMKTYIDYIDILQIDILQIYNLKNGNLKQ